MYIFQQLAHIEYMGKLLLFFGILSLVVLLLFLPIIIEIDAHYDMNRKKFAFAVYLYKKLKIVGGYVGIYPGGIALHISDKTAKLIPYSQLNSERKRFSFMRTFRLVAFTLTTETGAEYLLPIATAHTFLRAYFFIRGGDKEKIENNLWLTDGDVLRISLNSVIYFNLFILLCNLIKFIKEKIQILWQKKTKKSIA